MSSLKPALLALSIILLAPVMVHADEITLIPSVKLQIGDQDRSGNYWDGEHWHDRGWWEDNYERRDNHWHKRDKEYKKHKHKHDDNGHHGHHDDDDSQD